jgi:hypothetical protein
MFNAIMLAVALAIPSAPVAKPQPVKAERAWTCGNWQASAIGGSYKACEWK